MKRILLLVLLTTSCSHPAPQQDVDSVMHEHMRITPEQLALSLQTALERPETINCPPVEETACFVESPELLDNMTVPFMARNLPILLVCEAAGHEGYNRMVRLVRTAIAERINE